MGKPKEPQKRTRKAPVLPEGDLTASQAARELGVSSATLRRWVKEGRVEAVRVGKQWRFRRANLRRIVTVPSQEPAVSEKPAPEADLRKCERTLERLLRAQGVRMERIEAEISRELSNMTFEHDQASARVLAKILLVAAESTASDLHFEPFEGGAQVRQRVDGLLTEMITLPSTAYVALVSEIKRWSNLDVADKFRPQDGVVKMNIGARPTDFRLSVVPAQLGEVVAVRFMERAEQVLRLRQIGFEADQLGRWLQSLHRPLGLILVTAPAGCGKTTTIYASLMEIANPGSKIMTAEDPVELILPGVSQIQINSERGLDYATAARAMMRQAPNVIFIGEIRNRETAQILCPAALTGHLVFSTLHTNDAILAVRRLLDMGVETNVVASSLEAVAAQRLVRRICPDCKQEYRPNEREIMALSIPPEKRTGPFYQGRGCAKCRNLGYRGRVAVIELLQLSGKVREAIDQGRDNLRIADAARSAGWRPMTEIVVDKILRGETTIEEAVRHELLRKVPG